MTTMKHPHVTAGLVESAKAAHLAGQTWREFRTANAPGLHFILILSPAYHRQLVRRLRAIVVGSGGDGDDVRPGPGPDGGRGDHCRRRGRRADPRGWRGDDAGAD